MKKKTTKKQIATLIERDLFENANMAEVGGGGCSLVRKFKNKYKKRK